MFYISYMFIRIGIQNILLLLGLLCVGLCCCWLRWFFAFYLFNFLGGGSDWFWFLLFFNLLSRCGLSGSLFRFDGLLLSRLLLFLNLFLLDDLLLGYDSFWCLHFLYFHFLNFLLAILIRRD